MGYFVPVERLIWAEFVTTLAKKVMYGVVGLLVRADKVFTLGTSPVRFRSTSRIIAGNRGRIDPIIKNPCGAVPVIMISYYSELYVRIITSKEDGVLMLSVKEKTETGSIAAQPPTKMDRCDSCRAQAYASAHRLDTATLLFCAHHSKKYFDALTEQGFIVLDYTHLLHAEEAKYSSYKD